MGSCVSDQWIDGKEFFVITKKEYNEDNKFCKKIPREDDLKRSTLGVKNMPTDGLGGTKSVEGTVKVVIY